MGQRESIILGDPMQRAITCVVVFIAIASLVTCVSDNSSASQIEESFSIILTDSEGNDLSDPLFGGDVTIFFDTYNTSSGTIYKLKAMLAIKSIPANLVINASGGLFKLAVSAQGMDSFL